MDITIPGHLLERLFNPIRSGEAAAQLAQLATDHGMNLFAPGIIEPHMVAAAMGVRAQALADQAASAQHRQGTGWGPIHRHAYALGYLRGIADHSFDPQGVEHA